MRFADSFAEDSPRDVMKIAGARYEANARQLARVHAARNRLPWPLPRHG